MCMNIHKQCLVVIIQQFGTLNDVIGQSESRIPDELYNNMQKDLPQGIVNIYTANAYSFECYSVFIYVNKYRVKWLL